MKNIGLFLLLLAIIVFGTIFFNGIIKGIQKSFGNAPESNTENSLQMRKDQKARMRDIQDRQKRLIQDQRQKMRDMRR